MWINDFVRAIADLIRAGAWPGILLFILVRHHDRVGDLLTRLRETIGFKFDPPAVLQVSENIENPVEKLERLAPPTGAAAIGEIPPWVQALRTPLIRRVEGMITATNEFRAIENPDARQSALLTFAAAAIASWTFEQVEGTIWASQLSLLETLNASAAGMPRHEVKARFYDPAARRFPKWYVNYTFDQYIGFLASFWLVFDNGDKVTLQEDGREYLVWRTRQGKLRRVVA